MPVESAADLASFFNPDEFGERIRYRFAQDAATELVALWERPTGTASFANTDVNLDVHHFTVPRSDLPAPRQGGTVTIIATSQVFTVIREPLPSADGALWSLPAAVTG